MAENHPVGFQWVMEARAKGAKIIHVDPRFSRTSAMSDYWVPLRAGTDIIFLGALINFAITNNKYFHDYVVPYTNAATILRKDFQDTEDLGGLFSAGMSRTSNTTRKRGSMPALNRRETRPRKNQDMGKSAVATGKTVEEKLRKSHWKNAIPHCRTRAAFFRYSKSISPVTRRSWLKAPAVFPKQPSWKWQRCSPRHPGLKRPLPSVTRWDGRNIRKACRSYAPLPSCKC